MGLRGATLIARFLCELAMLAALAFWGYVVGEGPWAWLLGVGAPALAAVVWGAFVAPKARCAGPGPGAGADRAGAVRRGRGRPGAPPASAVAAVVLGVAGLVTSLLNEVQERRAGPETIRRR